MMQVDFLNEINSAFSFGCYAVQGHRIAKDAHTSEEILNSINCEVNNHIFRKGQQALGFSSSLSGSGMAFSFQYIKQVSSEVKATEAFNKELELKLIEDNHRIIYLDSATVYDRYTQQIQMLNPNSVMTVMEQISYLRKYILRGSLSLLFGKTDYANKVAHYATIPKMLLFGFLLSATTASWFMGDQYIINDLQWGLLTILFTISIAIAIPFRFYKSDTVKVLVAFPRIMLRMVKSVSNLKMPPHKPAVNAEYENSTNSL
jgi:hypothetical protein